MLYICEFTWYPGTTSDEVKKRIVQQHDLGRNRPEHIKGWYTLAGGGAGFLLVEYKDPRELSDFLTPYMDLMAFDVRAIYENDYTKAVEKFRKDLQNG